MPPGDSDAPCVLMARPGARAVALQEALRSAGLAPLSLDIMRLEARALTPSQESVLFDLDNFRRVICTSPFAAECLIEAVEARWPQLPVGVDFYATGRSTAELLEARLGVAVSAPASGSGSASEALLALPGFDELTGERVLLVAGEGGRELIETTLAERGATVTRLALYRRRLSPPPEGARRRLAAGDFAALIVTSGEQLAWLDQWCSTATRQRPLIVSSQRLATMATGHHYKCVFIAGDATPQRLAQTAADARIP